MNALSHLWRGRHVPRRPIPPGRASARPDDEIIRAAEPLDGHALTHKSSGRYWCVPLVDAAGWRLVRMGTVRRHAASSLHLGNVRPTWVGQCEYALYVAPDRPQVYPADYPACDEGMTI
ncbi:MAG: hypothetical protein KatS3mg038_1475 [Candidatus Kapaibacterium sp.]|nr:MAG: hypothetical protein KatS3mg038_1475 [Candidatus Kapabacteria bacterium]